MSAKAFYHKTPDDRSILRPIPTELWIRIMEHAGDSGFGLYDSSMTPSRAFSFIRATEKHETKELRTSLSIRSRMARVSKAWYTMAHPLLFEYIHLGKARGIASLREALLRSGQHTVSNNQGCALGWWTKRLDIDLRDNDQDDASIAEHLNQIADLITCLPRLQVLTFSITAHGYIRHKSSHILDSVSCRESLKAVIWYTNCLWPGLKSWSGFLERHDRLEMLRGPLTIDPINRVQLNALKMVHPLLYLASPLIPGRSINLTQIDLPAVRWMDYEVDELSTIGAVFERLGGQLTVVQLIHYTEIFYPTIAEHEFGPVLAKLWSTCHNLVQLNLVLRNWPSFIQSLATVLIVPKSVKNLGIRTQRSQITNFGLKRLLQDTLPMVLSQNPNLKVVQLLDQANTEQFYVHLRILEDGLQKVKGLGMTVQDHNGHALTSETRNLHSCLVNLA